MFTSLLERLDRLRPRTICVEAAHIYINETPNEEHFFCAQLGAQLANALSQNGFKPTRMLFVDDYHPRIDQVAFSLKTYIEKLTDEGFPPDEVVMESTLVKPAFCLMRSLPGERVKKNGRLYLRKPNLALMDDDGTISCNLLDATLYLDKFRNFHYSITVLPESYKGQQRNVKKLLQVFGQTDFPAANVYYSQDKVVKVNF